jgi:hypothetical protein
MQLARGHPQQLVGHCLLFHLGCSDSAKPKMPNREFASADPPDLAGWHGGLDRRRRAVDRDALDGILPNACAMRGRHFGWVVLTAVVAMAVAGY